jgi:hypothetical protein
MVQTIGNRVEFLFPSIPANILPDVMPTVSRYERQKAATWTARNISARLQYEPRNHRCIQHTKMLPLEHKTSKKIDEK